MKGYIRPQGKGSWEIVIYLGRVNGKRKNHTETFKGKRREAETRCSELVARHSNGQLSEVPNMAMSEYLQTWLKDCVKNSVQPRTYSDYIHAVEKRIIPFIGHIKLSKLSAFNVQNFYNSLKEQHGYSPQTILHTHRVLSRALDQAVKWNYLHQNVAKLADRPSVKRKEMLAMDIGQADKFLEAAQNDLHYTLWVFALDTGARPEEYFALKWNDANLEAGHVFIQRALCWNKTHGGGWYFGPTKTESSRRNIYLSPATIELLKRHRIKQLEEKLRMGKDWNDLDLIFCNSTGNPISLTNLRKRHFKPILEKAGLDKNIRIYDLRHSTASIMLEKNSNPKIVQQRLGHSSIKLTMDTYSHLNPEMMKSGRDAMHDAVFSKIKIAPD